MEKREFSSVSLFFVLISFFLMSGITLGATPDRLTFGMHAGPIFSNHWSTGETPEGYEKPSGESGLSLGVYSNLSLGKRFSLQGEIGFAEKGASHNLLIEGFPLGPIDVTYKTEHIEIPVWLKFYVIKGEKVRLYTGAGGYVAFLTKGKYTVENEFIPTLTEDLNDIRKTDLGFLFNWGLEIKVSPYFFHLEYRFSLGMTDISYPTGPGAPGIDLRHLATTILIGVSFDLN